MKEKKAKKHIKVQKQFAHADPLYRLGMMRQEDLAQRLERTMRDQRVAAARAQAQEQNKK